MKNRDFTHTTSQTPSEQVQVEPGVHGQPEPEPKRKAPFFDNIVL